MTTTRAGSARSESVLPTSPRAALLGLVSFEACMLLYQFAPLYKDDPRFAWIPTDPTGLFFALSVVIGAFILTARTTPRQGLYPLFAYLAVVVWFACSLQWSPSRSYGPDKVFSMATLVLWGLAGAALIIAPDRERVRRLFLILLIVAVIAAIEAITIYLTTGGGRIYVGSSSYLGLGRICGGGAIIVFVAWLSTPRHFGLAGLAYLGLFAVFAFVLLIGGGRGPLLATAGGLLLPLLAGVRSGRRGLRLARYQAPALALGLLAATAVALWVQAADETPETLQRMERILGGEGLSAAGSRSEYYTLAPDLWARAPVLGHGAGSWPLLTHRPDESYYPHNLVAEVAVEGGVLGLVLMVFLFAVVLRPVTFDRLRTDPLAMCTLMLFCMAFLNAMVSNDLAGNRVLFLATGLMTIFALPQDAERPQTISFLRPSPQTWFQEGRRASSTRGDAARSARART